MLDSVDIHFHVGHGWMVKFLSTVSLAQPFSDFTIRRNVCSPAGTSIILACSSPLVASVTLPVPCLSVPLIQYSYVEP